MNGKQITSLALMGLAVLYDVSPVDINPIFRWWDGLTISSSRHRLDSTA